MTLKGLSQMRHVPVPVATLAALIEATKRVMPRGADDGHELAALVHEAERLLWTLHASA
jgi:hypothetical protein